jgi:hypothetical protein
MNQHIPIYSNAHAIGLYLKLNIFEAILGTKHGTGRIYFRVMIFCVSLSPLFFSTSSLSFLVDDL